VKPNHLRLMLRLKMTINRVTDVHSQFLEGLTLRKDRLAQRSRIVAALNVILYHKYNFVNRTHGFDYIS
jgi:hypothetical protein